MRKYIPLIALSFIIAVTLVLFIITKKNDDNETLSHLGLPKQGLLGQPIVVSKNHWVLVNYWATWCKPCIKEMPALDALHKAHPNVTVIGVNFDHASTHKIVNFVKRMNVHYPILDQFPAKQLGIEHIKAIPVTFVFGPDGKLKESLYGEQTQEQLERYIK
tara:strand:+ start:65728 stop:66210 length:483 start_codon:yes stop_codon:yes gene_type:complete